jgi:hypothetical protein
MCTAYIRDGLRAGVNRCVRTAGHLSHWHDNGTGLVWRDWADGAGYGDPENAHTLPGEVEVRDGTGHYQGGCPACDLRVQFSVAPPHTARRLLADLRRLHETTTTERSTR